MNERLRSAREKVETIRQATSSTLSVTLVTGDVAGVKSALPVRTPHEQSVRLDRRRLQQQIARDGTQSQLIRNYTALSDDFEYDDDIDQPLGKKKPADAKTITKTNAARDRDKQDAAEQQQTDSKIPPVNFEKSFIYESPRREAITDEERRYTYDKNLYVQSCEHYHVPPVSYFLRHMYDDKLEMRHHGLGDQGIKPICLSLLSNARVHQFDVSDNGIGPAGGMAIWEMIIENIFLTHVDLSKNPFGTSAGYLSKLDTALLENSQIVDLTLSSTGLDDEAAPCLAKIISLNTKLERLVLSHNRLGEKAGQLIGKALSENSVITDLDLSWNAIRGKGMKAIFDGLKKNTGLRKFNISWNGFGSANEALTLGRALKENFNLLELDIASNRLTPEHAVLIGRGLSVNTVLQTLRLSKNPLRSAGCYAICAAILKNPEPCIRLLEFTNIVVNNDCLAILQTLKEKVPDMEVKHGPEEVPLRPRAKASALSKLLRYLNKMNIKVNEFFDKYDQDGSMSLTHEEFRVAVDECGINMTHEEIDELIAELDRDGDGDINYTEMIIGSASVNDKSSKSLNQSFK